MKKQLLTIVAALLLFTSANAIEFGIGVSGSMAMVSADGKETETSNTGTESSTRDASVDAMTGVASIYAEAILDNGVAFGLEIVPMSADVSDATHSRTVAKNFDLIQLIESITEDFNLDSANQKRKIKIVFDLPVKLKKAEIFGIESRIEQVIANLLENAVSFSPEEKDVVINLTQNKQTFRNFNQRLRAWL